MDGGILGAQLAFRTSSTAVLVASICPAGSLDKNGLAEKLAREIAGRL